MNTSLTIKTFIKSYKNEMRFVLYFILFFFLLQIAHYSLKKYTSSFLIHTLNTEVSSKIINFITPNEKTFTRGNTIRSGGFSIRVAQGCEGIEGILLIIAALGAFRMGLKQKLSGMLVGTLVIYISNLVRIIALYYTLKYKPGLFDLIHVYVGQTFIILIGVFFFIVWINKFAELDEKKA